MGGYHQPIRADGADRVAGLAEFERHLIRSRTEDGRRAALARGVAFGRPRKMSPRQVALARELIHEGKSISEVARVR